MKPPVEVTHLFPLIDKKLIDLLKSISAEEWRLPTLAKQWTVKDVAAHLLDGNMRVISGNQGYNGPLPPPIDSYNDLVNYLNELNAVWVKAMQRVSPKQLVNMLEETGKEYSRIMAEAPLFEPARYSVAWAGEEVSLNWFHIAREYTEKMHHQLQIREAVDKEAALMTREYFYPFIDTLMYGLPHALRHTTAKEESAITVTVTSEIGGDWHLIMQDKKWRLSKEKQGAETAHVFIGPGFAWKLFTKGITPAEAIGQIQMQGDEQLCKSVLGMVAVMA